MDTQQNQNPNMGQTPKSGFLSDMENFFHNLYLKVPWHLPPKFKEFIVSVGPWITLIIIIFAIPLALAVLGMNTFFVPFAMMYGGAHAGGQFFVGGIIGIGALLLEAFALPGLFARTLNGWHLLFYAVLLNALGNLIRFDVVGFILGLAISLYVLFEIKSYYH